MIIFSKTFCVWMIDNSNGPFQFIEKSHLNLGIIYLIHIAIKKLRINYPNSKNLLLQKR